VTSHGAGRQGASRTRSQTKGVERTPEITTNNGLFTHRLSAKTTRS